MKRTVFLFSAIFAFALSLGLIVSSHAQSYRSKGDRKKLDKARPAALQESNATRGDKDAIRPFRVHVPEKEITDLRRRIRETRWPDKETVASGDSAGLCSHSTNLNFDLVNCPV